MKIQTISLGQAYKKQGKELDIKVNKAFMVPLDSIFAEDGFNVRELDRDHIESIASAYSDGALIPAIIVKTMPNGFKIIDGHHRFEAAKLANVMRIECKEFVGNEADQVAFMVSSSQGRQLKPVERAQAYNRMVNLGMTVSEICKKVGRSRSDVDNHLLLLTADSQVIDAVKSGEISATEVSKEIRKSGSGANEKIINAVSSAKKSGKKASIKNFKAKHFRRVMEILSDSEIESFGEEFKQLIELYESDNN